MEWKLLFGCWKAQNAKGNNGDMTSVSSVIACCSEPKPTNKISTTLHTGVVYKQNYDQLSVHQTQTNGQTCGCVCLWLWIKDAEACIAEQSHRCTYEGAAWLNKAAGRILLATTQHCTKMAAKVAVCSETKPKSHYWQQLLLYSFSFFLMSFSMQCRVKSST